MRSGAQHNRTHQLSKVLREPQGPRGGAAFLALSQTPVHTAKP